LNLYPLDTNRTFSRGHSRNPPALPLASPARMNRRHLSAEMRRQAEIAYAAALEVLG
jgi:hypothetical protein